MDRDRSCIDHRCIIGSKCCQRNSFEQTFKWIVYISQYRMWVHFTVFPSQMKNTLKDWFHGNQCFQQRILYGIVHLGHPSRGWRELFYFRCNTKRMNASLIMSRSGFIFPSLLYAFFSVKSVTGYASCHVMDTRPIERTSNRTQA